MLVQPADLVFSKGEKKRKVAVVIPVYNYRNYICEALQSVVSQDFEDLAIIVINDASPDDSLEVARTWLEVADLGGKSAFLLSNQRNAGLSITRNTGIDFAESELCFFLDADNSIYSTCIRKHVEALDENPGAAAAYSLIEVFGAEAGIMGSNVFNRERLKKGNYIDAMAMIRRGVLVDMGGYRPIKHGWEDYDIWLQFCEQNRRAIQIPEVLSRYRVHHTSMLRTQTNVHANLRELFATMYKLHPWLKLSPIPDSGRRRRTANLAKPFRQATQSLTKWRQSLLRSR